MEACNTTSTSTNTVVETLVAEVQKFPPEECSDRYVLLSPRQVREIVNTPEFQVQQLVIAGTGYTCGEKSDDLNDEDFHMMENSEDDDWESQRKQFIMNQRRLWNEYRKKHPKSTDALQPKEKNECFESLEPKPVEEKEETVPKSLENESFYWVDDLPWDQPYSNQLETRISKESFFDNWPSFSVSSKLSLVWHATGRAVWFGFGLGAGIAIDVVLNRLLRNPAVLATLSFTTAVGIALAPSLLLNAVEYVIIGGVVGSAVVAAPVFVVGAGGVFMCATAFHAYTAA